MTTKEEKAPTAGDVKQHGEAVRAAVTGALGPDATFAALGSLTALLNAALLGVQVPGLREELRLRSKALEAAQEVSALQGRVAELERPWNEPGDFAALSRLIAAPATDTIVRAYTEAETRFEFDSSDLADALRERDALRAQVEALRDTLSELADLMDATHAGDYSPDSFTTQPARAALSTPPAEEKPETRKDPEPCGAYVRGSGGSYRCSTCGRAREYHRQK